MTLLIPPLPILLSPESCVQVVNRWITKVQDHKEPHFIQLADLVLALHQEKLVSTGEVVEGLRETMESMAVSAERAWYITASVLVV